MAALRCDRRADAGRLLPESNGSQCAGRRSGGRICTVLGSRRPASPGILHLLTRHLLFGLVVCVVMIPTFASRTVVYGGPFETGYLSIRDFLWRSPVFFSVLFSSDHGLLSWTPLLGFAILGLLFFALRLPQGRNPIFQCPGGLLSFHFLLSGLGGDLLLREPFFRFSLTALFILGLGVFSGARCAQFFRSRKAAFAAASAVLSVFVLWNAGLMFQWGLHLIPVRGPVSFSEIVHNQFFVVPRRIATDLEVYLFRRKTLMKQIENRDLRQLE